MTISLLVLLLASPASAQSAMPALEALRGQAAADPSGFRGGEGASARAGKSFDQGFTVETLSPVAYTTLDGKPRDNPPPAVEERPLPAAPEKKPGTEASAPGDPGDGADYYFEGKKPLNGITIYSPKKGNGSTTEGESPTAKYGTYGKIGIGLGVLALGVGLALGGTPLVVLALVGGLLIGAGAVLTWLFGGKKK